MRNFLWLIAIFFLVVVQIGILQPLGIAAVSLMLILVIFSVILSDFNQGLFITLASGVMTDFISGLPDGLLTLSLLAVFLSLHFIQHKILAREINRIMLFASVGFGTIIYFAAFLIFGGLSYFFRLMPKPDLSFIILRNLPLALILNLVFAFPMFVYYLYLQKWLIRFNPKI